MKCPHCGKRINPAAILGAAGGKATGASKSRDPEKMRLAAMKRWEIHRKTSIK